MDLKDKTMKDKLKDIPNYDKTKAHCIITGSELILLVYTNQSISK